MKQNYLILFLTSLIFSCNMPTETISLFNGKNLDGWIIYGTEKWYVEDGELICESGPDKDYGYLGTNKYFDDFILELDFKQEDNGNSGVFLDQLLMELRLKGGKLK